MSGKKAKSALGIVLARSLDIGKTGKVQTGTWEAGLSGTGQSESVKKIKTAYNFLVGLLKSAEDALVKAPATRKAPLEQRRETLVTSMGELESRSVTNTEPERETMLADINVQIEAARKLVTDIAAAVRLGDKVARVITYTQPTEVTTQTVMTVGSLKAAADPPVKLRLVQGGSTVDKVQFLNNGNGQKFRIEADETDSHLAASEIVAVDVAVPKRVITWSPPKKIVWGTKLTIESLGASATGLGEPLVLDPPDGILAVGDAMPLKITASGKGGKWQTSEAVATVQVTRLTRKILCPKPGTPSADKVLTPELLGATLSAGDGTLTVIEPVGGRITAAGEAVKVVLSVAETATHSAADLTLTLTIPKGVPELTWATPKAALVGDKLAAAHLNAVVKPVSLKPSLVYAPALGTDLTTAGNVFLRVSFAGDAKFEAAAREVRLQVLANEELQRGSDAMRNGAAWKKPTAGDAAKLATEWDDDDGSDPASLKMMGQKLMAEISQMTADELNDHLDAIQQKTADSARTAQGGTYPNIIWTFKNGLQIRYKKNGDIFNPGKPMFCMEARTSVGPSNSGAEVAFKVTPDGDAAAKGPGDTVVPGDITEEDDIANFKTGTTRATHLFCRPKDKQVVTWANPPDITSATPLTAELHLNASTLGGVKPEYWLGTIRAVAPGQRLPVGNQTLRAIADKTPRYEKAEATVTIKVTAPQKK